MTQHTEKLIQKQKKLKDMNQLMPIANKTNEFMNSIDIDKHGINGNLRAFKYINIFIYTICHVNRII